MRKLLLVVLMLSSLGCNRAAWQRGLYGAAVGAASVPTPTATARPMTASCNLKGERTSGFNKICYYDCLGSEAAITIKSVELCPLTIEH